MDKRGSLSTIGHSLILGGKIMSIGGFWFPPIMIPGVALAGGAWIWTAASDTNAIIKEKKEYSEFVKKIEIDLKQQEIIVNIQKNIQKLFNDYDKYYYQFESSNFKNRNIDRKNKEIEKITEINKWVLNSRSLINIFEDYKIESSDLKHSQDWINIRASLEATAKLIPSPLSGYLIYRDNKERKERTSLNDIEKSIKNLKEQLEKVKESSFDCFPLLRKLKELTKRN
ncbi:MAG: hypothetical protein mread185_000444 [Mycoplasmataceae bacterium]|nr:MAG: hypothetical protein mread185_000444 [Mycoplasmataceae bacterium]